MTELIVGGHQSDTHQKALRINLDPRWYGTIAEIGAGQEVVRWFFRVGGAAGTVAKSISAYDMAVSDAVYGKAERYVSVGRLQGMLDKEFQLNVERLGDERGDSSCFFAFADTVVARSFRGGNECHGLRLYVYPLQPSPDDELKTVDDIKVQHEIQPLYDYLARAASSTWTTTCPSACRSSAVTCCGGSPPATTRGRPWSPSRSPSSSSAAGSSATSSRGPGTRLSRGGSPAACSRSGRRRPEPAGSPWRCGWRHRPAWLPAGSCGSAPPSSCRSGWPGSREPR